VPRCQILLAVCCCSTPQHTSLNPPWLCPMRRLYQAQARLIEPLALAEAHSGCCGRPARVVSAGAARNRQFGRTIARSAHTLRVWLERVLARPWWL
jgi:hypothetical protein